MIQASKLGGGETDINGMGNEEIVAQYGGILVEAVERLKEELDG